MNRFSLPPSFFLIFYPLFTPVTVVISRKEDAYIHTKRTTCVVLQVQFELSLFARFFASSAASSTGRRRSTLISCSVLIFLFEHQCRITLHFSLFFFHCVRVKSKSIDGTVREIILFSVGSAFRLFADKPARASTRRSPPRNFAYRLFVTRFLLTRE